MGWLDSFLHPEKGYKAAQDTLNNYYTQGQNYIQPYNQNGQDSYNALNEAQYNMMHPEELNKKWTESYVESPQAKQAEAMARERGLSEAQAMGLGGSNTALDTLQQGTTQIGLNDRQNYLDSLWQKYLAGTGINQNIYNTGASTANNMSNNAMNMGQNSAGLSYGQTNAPGDMFGKLVQGAATFATPIGQAFGMSKLGLNNNPWSTGGGR